MTNFMLKTSPTTAESPTYPQSQQKQPEPPQSPEKVLLHVLRNAIMMFLHALDVYLGVEPKERVICPSCNQKWNKK